MSLNFFGAYTQPLPLQISKTINTIIVVESDIQILGS